MSAVGVPGHCWFPDGRAAHKLGECTERDCDHECCAPEPFRTPNEVMMSRLFLLDQVRIYFETHGEYAQVFYKREVIADTEIITAIFRDNAGREIAQHILHQLDDQKLGG